ncbi:unnamed protein product [Schistosoma margrebowiei]|uniref:Uncharacterized protein n=1 Tax=Schistosoma margrebowiei TaxID=48269 RepID=A0A183N9Z4_9TREM|nr:unnamed protein product [Schistosoma margrebowiei]
MRRYNLEVLRISETHWTQFGQQRLTTGELLLYSGHEEENAPHTQGVTLMLSKQAQNALIGWESHGPRIIKASFKTKKEGTSMNAAVNRREVPNKGPTILMENFNAKVGTDNTGYQDIMGRHGQGERNENGTTVESNWKGIKEAITSTCHEVLGHKKHHYKEWITVDTLDKIQEKRNKKVAINNSRTRAEKAKAQAEYTKVNKQVKKSIRTDKRKYVEDLAKTTEKAAREGNMRQPYDITKKLSGNRRKPERPVKSKEAEVFTNIEEQQNRWVEQLQELLNRPAPLNPPNIEAAPTDLPINVGPTTIEEISMAIRQIKNGKAAGPDNIPAEALKADTKSQLYGSLWNNQLNGIHHSTSTSLTTKRHLIAWTEQHYRNFFDTTACLRR